MTSFANKSISTLLADDVIPRVYLTVILRTRVVYELIADELAIIYDESE
jgi:hypothetical protein